MLSWTLSYRWPCYPVDLSFLWWFLFLFVGFFLLFFGGFLHCIAFSWIFICCINVGLMTDEGSSSITEGVNKNWTVRLRWPQCPQQWHMSELLLIDALLGGDTLSSDGRATLPAADWTRLGGGGAFQQVLPWQTISVKTDTARVMMWNNIKVGCI